MSATPKGKNLALMAYASTLLLYFHLILFIAVLGIALLLNFNKKQEFTTFHHRQMFGIAVIAFLITAFSNIVPSGWVAIILITTIVFIAILGFLDATRNQMTPLPVVGGLFQKWFSFIK
ncbi:hypothetical protein [Nonlabens marinus]|uniref:DUF4870 domain-containing protein n=1 Tax=Nonlabens marinus S1-08 TaxID=1454201 RepID=W8W0L1_9FLAO|nr:hypothetical protein [Nonlabens marinus]BAO56516.1 hypothetical protein NMS_2507 [Nonlabens marinus S1-08]